MCPGPASWQLAPAPSGPTEFPELEPQREHWEQRRQRLRRRYQRSVSKEKWVETLVVADTKMVEYHGQPNVESYVLTIMNMVRLPQAACGGGGVVRAARRWCWGIPKGTYPRLHAGYRLPAPESLGENLGICETPLEVMAPHWLSSLCPLLGPE